MKSLEIWLGEYAESHQNPVNISIHHLCVPMIMFSLLGMLWLLPGVFYNNFPPYFNLAVVLVVAALIYYFLLSWRVAIGMLLVALFMLFVILMLSRSELPLFEISLLVFILAWLGQLIGHKIEGKKPSFFKDMQFLLIGPLWVLIHLYDALGIEWKDDAGAV